MNARTSPHDRDLLLHTADGVELVAHCWEPAGHARAAVILLGALAVPQRYYRHFAAWLAERGYAVLTFDYRGIGASRRPSIHDHADDDLDAWCGPDVDAALDALHALAGDLPRIGVAHSLGGQLPGLNPRMSELDGLYAVGAQLAWAGNYPAVVRPAFQFVVRTAGPALTRSLGYFPAWAGMGEDVPRGVALQWTRWLATEGYYLSHVPGSRERLEGWTTPTHLLGFTDDAYAPPPGVGALADLLPATSTTEILSPADVSMRRVGHFGFFRRDAEPSLWGRVDRWIGGLLDA
jgi:predicted alpha/beta hydrolase